MSAERITLWDNTLPNEKRKVVFGRGSEVTNDPAARAGLDSRAAPGTSQLVGFRRNDNDRRPPSRVLTAQLLGDPRPDREAVSDALRQKLVNRRPMPVHAAAKVIAVLRPLADGPKSIAELVEAMGVGSSAASDRAAAAVARGLVRRIGPHKASRKFAITDEGLQILEAQPQ